MVDPVDDCVVEKDAMAMNYELAVVEDERMVEDSRRG